MKFTSILHTVRDAIAPSKSAQLVSQWITRMRDGLAEIANYQGNGMKDEATESWRNIRLAPLSIRNRLQEQGASGHYLRRVDLFVSQQPEYGGHSIK
ncbi:MAG: hypothetical protein KJ718_03675 [Nanoarchaeota archaeon]|nr:hypothetical protein [Nanoarchaeota archaeon]MBU1051630.1 hypothetical protein [Nanoarchaeota archaeon]MBU1988832.1 hypothetical protein [Nanoarchaeota archaeon]